MFASSARVRARRTQACQAVSVCPDCICVARLLRIELDFDLFARGADMPERRAAQVISIKAASARVKAERIARLKAARRAARLESGHRETDPRWMALLRLILLLALVVGGVLLVRELRGVSQLQDCVMSGRTNCAPIETRPPQGTPAD